MLGQSFDAFWIVTLLLTGLAVTDAQFDADSIVQTKQPM
jgi:hypothetical protein